ncbi:MAG: hypothetical protein ACI9KE_000990 [Polyangiales bacterium]
MAGNKRGDGNTGGGAEVDPSVSSDVSASEPVKPHAFTPVKENAVHKDSPKEKSRWSIFQKHDVLTQLVLTMPVFLIYHLGILLMDTRNGVDFATSLFLRLLNASVFGYVVVTLVFALGLILVAARLRKTNRLRLRAIVPLLVESSVLAVGMLVSVGWFVSQVSMSVAASTLQSGLPPMNLFEKIVMSCGAGFHEELVFRVVLFGGLLMAARLVTQKTWQKVLFAAVISSVLFSGVHYVGSLSDSFTFVSFFFRFVAGLYLCAVYRLRGFAYAVYTHAIYDVLVMVFLT